MPRAKLNLLCFPYAGGSTATFRAWPSLLGDLIEVHAVQLPGRGPRLEEARMTSISGLADGLSPNLDEVCRRPCAFFGHSMGAVLAFEVARRRAPRHLFVSARIAPHRPHPRPNIHGLSNHEFISALRAMEGTPEEVLADPELMELLLPILRDDFRAIETYSRAKGVKVACGISAIGGVEDRDVSTEDLLAWQDHTDELVLVEMAPGGHFFIDRDPGVAMNVIKQDLAKWL